jgi:DNA-binding MarR family transcriptional regulator
MAPRNKREVDDVRAVMDALRKIFRGLRLSARSAERSAGMSGAQLFVLQALAEESARSLNALAERTRTDQSSVSVVVARLVDKKLVVRKASAADGRRVELQLTQAGKRVLSRVPQATQSRLVAALSRLDHEERASLRAGLEALVRETGLESEKAQLLFSDDDGPPRKRR